MIYSVVIIIVWVLFFDKLWKIYDEVVVVFDCVDSYFLYLSFGEF